MPPPQTWAELPGDLLRCVAGRHRHALTSYLAALGVCRAWRSALPPPSPLLLLVAGDGGTVSAFSVPLRMAFSLDKICKHDRYIGAGHGWLAVAYYKEVRVVNDDDSVGTQQVTRDPIAPPAAAAEITMEQRMDQRQAKEQYYMNFEGARVRVDPDELQAIAKRRRGRETSCMALLNPVTGRKIELPEHVRLDPMTVSKVAFAPNPREDDFTVVVAFGLSSLAYISSRDGAGASWSFGGLPLAGENAIADVVYREGGGDRVYCLTRGGDVHVLHVPRGGPTTNRYPVLVPLVAGCRFNFNPGYVFPPPYDRLSEYLGTKSLAFCDGEVYQLWRNSASTMRVQLNKEGGARLRVALHEVVVLRYEPASSKPCWKVVGDLGGHAVFVGPANSALSVRAVPAGIKGDCVYWLDRFGDRTAMAFDIKTRRSAPCVSPSAARGVPVCWYSLGDMVASGNDADGQVLEREPKQRRLV